MNDAERVAVQGLLRGSRNSDGDIDEYSLERKIGEAVEEAYERGRKDGYKQGNKDGHFSAWENAIAYQQENLLDLFDSLINQAEKLKEDVAAQEPGAYAELKDGDIPANNIPNIKRRAI